MTSWSGRVRGVLAGSGAIAVAMGVMNVATYGYNIVAARLLGPQRYGAFAAVLGLLLVIGVLQLGLQATGARRIASEPGNVAQIERSVMRVTYRAAWALAGLCLLLAPVINIALHLDSLATSALVALIAWPLTVMGGQAGILQGERRWQALALLYLFAGVPRLLVGSALIFFRPSEASATLGVALGFFAPVAVGWWMLRRSAGSRSRDVSGTNTGRAIFWETVRNSHALLAFFALSNTDVILARSILGDNQSGLYAGGLILTKAVLFLPQFVVVVAFPAMSDEGARRDTLVRSVGLVLGLGVIGTAVTWLLSGLALVFIGGPDYAGVQDRLWLFAILGTLLSLIQLLIYSVVARQSTYSVYLVWATLVVLLVTASRMHTTTGLVTTVCLVDGSLFLMLLGISLWRLRTGPALEARKVAPPVAG